MMKFRRSTFLVSARLYIDFNTNLSGEPRKTKRMRERDGKSNLGEI